MPNRCARRNCRNVDSAGDDTRIDVKRWTRQQAIDYLKQNTPNAETDCIDSINRYVVMPSQATAYKIGMLKILELREKAKRQLGPKFEELADKWVKSKRSGNCAVPRKLLQIHSGSI